MTYVPLIALIVAIAVACLGYYYFRAGRKRTQLRYDVAVERKFPPGSAAKITIDGKAVNEPYEVTLWLQPTGVKDVTSSAFDEGTEFALSLGAPIVTAPTSDTTLTAKGEPGDERVVIPKQMLKCGSLVYASLIVDGEPDPVLQGGLADVDIVKFDVADAGRQTLKGLVSSQPLTAIGTTAAFAGVFLALVAFVLPEASTKSDEQLSNDAARRAISEAFAQGQLGVGYGLTGIAATNAGNERLKLLVRQAVDEALNARGIGQAPSANPVPGAPSLPIPSTSLAPTPPR